MANFQIPAGARRIGPIGNALLGGQPLQVTDVSPSFWFSPLQPVTPSAPAGTGVRQWPYQPGVNLMWQPKTDENGYGFELLRALAENLDILRIVLEMKKDEIVDVEYEIRLKRLDGEKQADYKARAQKGAKQLQDVKQFFIKPDGYRRWRRWLRMLAEDLLVIDAMSVYLPRDSKGKVARLMPVDGATWNRLLTDEGITPQDPESAAFQQILYGFASTDVTVDDIVYAMQNERTFRRYGFSRVERVFNTIALALNRQTWIQSEYCYSDDTEVLTKRGWLKWPDVEDNDYFASRSKTGEFEWQQPSALTRNRFKGQMLRFSNRSLDLLVTPNHRMVVAGIPQDQFGRSLGRKHSWEERIFRADDLAAMGMVDERLRKRSWMPQTSYWQGIEIGDIEFQTPEDGRYRPLKMSGDQFCAFMGMYLSDGNTNAYKPTCVEICQPRDKHGIWAIFNQLLADILGEEVYHDGRVFSFSRKPLAEYLTQFGYAHDKFVPDVILNATSRQLEIFWRYFVLGDGEAATATGKQHRSQQCFTVSRRLADGLTEVIQKIGLAATTSFRPPSDHEICGRLTHSDGGYVITARRTDGGTKGWESEAVDYDGEVFCATVPNGILYVRRNGKYAWCGNTVGNIPEAFLFMPSNIPPQRLKEFQDYLDSILSGNLANRRKVRIMPGFGDQGRPNYLATKEPLLKDELDVWLAQLCCACVGVSAQPFLKMINRASAEESNDAAREKMLKPDVDHVCDFVNDCLERMGLTDYEMASKPVRDTDPLKQAQADKMVWGIVYTANELREQRGEDPIEGKNANRLGTISPQNGFIPLDPDDEDIALMQQLKGPAGGGPNGNGSPNGNGGGSAPKKPSGGTQKMLGAGALAKYKHGVVMVPIDEASEAGQRMKAMREAIDSDHLMSGNGDGKKLETQPHVTVRYGIKSGSDLAGLAEYLTNLKPFTLKFGKSFAFAPSEQSEGAAPLVVHIESEDLQRINDELAGAADFTAPTFDYSPHATLAYVKPSEAHRYIDDDYLDGVSHPVHSMIYAMPGGEAHEIMLTGGFEKADRFHDGHVSIFQTEHQVDYTDQVMLDAAKAAVVPVADNANQSDNIDAGFEASPGVTQSSTVEVEPERADHKPMQAVVNTFLKAAATGAMDRLRRYRDMHKGRRGKVRKDDQQEADALLNAANDIAWSQLIPQMQPLIQQAADFGVTTGLHQVSVAGVGDVSAYIGKAQELAADYARERAAEMVGKKYLDGALVDNPNARWSIAETTRDQLRDLITKSLEEKTDIDDLIQQIQDSVPFSEDRAETIAITETHNAQSNGVAKAWQQTQAVELVDWSCSSLGCCDICAENEAAGPIPFGTPFPSGHKWPGAHPRCRCVCRVRKVRGRAERPNPNATAQ